MITSNHHSRFVTWINVNPFPKDQVVIRLAEVFDRQDVLGVLVGLRKVVADKVGALQKKPDL